MIDKNAPTARRLIVSRVLLVVVAILAAYTASTKPSDILAMVSWAFSLAAGGLFPALVLGIWWKRANSAGAIAGIAVGFGLTLFYLVISRYYPHVGVQYFGMSSLLNPVSGAPLISAENMAKFLADPAIANGPVLVSNPLASKVGWFNINNISSALFGLPAGFLAMYVVSMLTAAPSKAMMDFVDACRRPRGGTIMEEKTS
jgi:cation/acetate symporter